MFFVFMLGSIFMIVHRLRALCAKAPAGDSWQTRRSAGCSRSARNSQDVHTWHHLGMWVIVVFVDVHVYAAVREDIMSRQSMISSMITGERMFKRRRQVTDRCGTPTSWSSASATSCGPTKASACARWRRSTASIASPTTSLVLDGGTQGLYLVQFVQEADHLIVFDAIDYGLLPGTLKLVEDDEVPKFTGAKKMSLHQTGFQEVLSAADLLGDYPEKLALIGCQPEDLEDWGGPLTQPVRDQLVHAAEVAATMLEHWGAPCVRRDPGEKVEPLLANDIDHLSYERQIAAA